MPALDCDIPAAERLDGLRVVVTGSTRGLGLAFARDLVARGAWVVINGTSDQRSAEVARELTSAGGRAVACGGSVADEETCERLIATCVEHFGGVDALVNNAGITRDRMLVKMSAEAFDEVVAVHLRGTWLATRAAARAMGGGGSIVNVVSGSAMFGLVGQSNYAAAKGGVLGLTRALSVELAASRIRVNAVAPISMTDMVEPVLTLAGDRRAEFQALFGAPGDIAPLVAYLASPVSNGITAQVFSFDGRELALWTHPSVLRRARRESPWSSEAISAFASKGELARLHPDRVGSAVLELVGHPRPRGT